MTKIKFGTSGWRAIIGEDFTFANVRIVVQAIADYVKKHKAKNAKPKTVIVGGDARFLSDEFAKEAAKVLSANGIRVFLCDRDTPTPTISYHILAKKCAGGINFTASHNPPEYNGIKFSPETGGPAQPDVTEQIEKAVAKLQKKKKPLVFKADEKLITVFDPRHSYLKQLEKVVDFGTIRRAKLKVAIDCLYGTSRDYLDYILKKQGYKPTVLHDYINPYFDGRRPEPAPENIEELVSIVKNKRFNLGLAADGDGDRFGIIDSDGTYITPNEIIALLLYHLLRTRKRPGRIIARSLATSHMVDLIARAHGIEIVETPVGFKYFVDLINGGDCIIAGEESGGLSISGHLPEKDGILACLLITEMVAKEKKSIRSILKQIYKKYGRLYSDRINLELTDEKKQALMKKVKSPIVKIAGLKIVRKDTRDGYKFYLQDGSWILFRPSGTEPVVRIYFESYSKKTLSALRSFAQKLI